MESSIVIKVKYEDTLRRFNALIVREELDLNMDGLREKIFSLFKFAPDTQLSFTYNDEDNDVVALVDDEDLRDVVRQGLNPLRITVSLSTAKSLNSSAHSSGSSIPSLSSPLEEKIQNLNSNVSEILKSLPEPLRQSLSRLSSDLAKKASTYGASNVAEISDSLSKLGLHYLNQLSELPPTDESTKSREVNKGSDGIKNLVVPTEVTSEVSCGKPTSKNNKVLQKSKSPFMNNGVKSSLAASGASSIITSLPLDPSVANAHVASKDKREVKETSEKAGVKYSDAPSVAKICSSSGMEYSFHCCRPSDGSRTTSVEDWSKKKSASGSQYSSFPPGSATSLNECPFTGMPMINDTSIPHDAPSGKPETISNYSPGIFHRGILCDGCGVRPITGPRFKSKVRENYDLCSICFAEMGNDADFTRIDHPVVHRHPISFKGSYRHHGWRTVAQRLKSAGAELTPLLLDSSFVYDVTILDGTIIPPLTHFTKIWRMRNNGTTVWPRGTQLVWIGGVRMSTSPSIELEIIADGMAAGHELDVAVDFVAPEQNGRHISYWRMALPTGQIFGQRVWVLIEVEAYKKKPMHAARPGFNLNLPPATDSVTAPEVSGPISEPMMSQGLPKANMSNVPVETADVPIPGPIVDESLPEPNTYDVPIEIAHIPIPDPTVDKSLPEPNMYDVPIETADIPIPYLTVDKSLPEPNMSNASLGTMEPVVNLQVSKEQEAKFPIDDSLLVGGIKNNAWHAGPSSSVSYPIIDLTPSSDMGILESDEVDDNAQIEEEALLKELEEMGFKHAALNKEILQMNKNDLEQTIDDLCGSSEWDPILEELEEMGFYDRNMNRKLLRKNDGSITRVVMDLISGE